MTGERPYDDKDVESILDYAGRLTGRTLGEMILDDIVELDIQGDLHSKGYFGQVLESEYFLIENNNLPEPDFGEVGIELKSAPLKEVAGKGLVSKERMVLGVIDYNEVPEKGFGTFLDKNSRILMVFFKWEKGESIFDYVIEKVVDWLPTAEELRVIREDWNVIERFIMEGRAELLSERHTEFLAACRKGAGNDRDSRPQPFSDAMAPQRALSFKASFVTEIYRSHEDVNYRHSHDNTDDGGDSVLRSWKDGVSFEQHVLDHFSRFEGMTCGSIEDSLGEKLNEGSKSYYSTLALRMLGVEGKRVKEFDQAGIKMKTIRLKQNGKPKESMSFPAFKYVDVAEQEWEESEFYEQIDRRFLFIVYRFQTPKPQDEPKRDLVFEFAFFWSVPDDDMDMIKYVWTDTKEKILHEDFDNFIGSGEDRLVHVRPHAKDRDDTFPYNGREYTKRSFWFNDSYIQRIVEESRGQRRHLFLERSKSGPSTSRMSSSSDGMVSRYLFAIAFNITRSL